MGDFSYEHLFDVLRRERAREELQQLEDDFYVRATDYVATHSSRVRELDVLSDQAETSRQQLHNAKKLLKELYDRREKKILLLALNKAKTNSSIIDTSSLLAEEQALFDGVLSSLSTARLAFSSFTSGSSVPPRPKKPASSSPKPISREPATTAKSAPEPKTNNSDTSKEPASGVPVKITADVPKFMGSANETFGPYTQGQEAVLPKRIADILVKKGRAEHA